MSRSLSVYVCVCIYVHIYTPHTQEYGQKGMDTLEYWRVQTEGSSRCLSLSLCAYIYIYIYIYTHTHEYDQEGIDTQACTHWVGYKKRAREAFA